MTCPNCGFENADNLRFCGSCGTRLTSACPECGFANPLSFRFCGMCGTRLIADEPALSPSSQLLPASEAEPLLPSAAPPLEGERRVVTVLLTDLTDSTDLLEKIGTEGWVELMNRILRILESEIYRFGGEIGQFRGDGLVAFFGAMVAHEDDPERAVLAALSMQRAFDSHVREQLPPGASDLRMRVGVSTGEVIVNSDHDRQHWQEAAMGIAVAVAARMETAAEPGTVLVSEHTHRLAESQFDWQPLGEISVKGVSQPIAVYRPVRHITDTELLPYRETFPERVPLIGREAEFQALKAGVEGLFAGRGGIVTVTGDKGSGKSFLLSEVRQFFVHREALLAETRSVSSAAENPLTWVRGRCRSYSQTWPYSMWVDLFWDWLGIRPDASKEEKLASLRRRAEEFWGDSLVEHYPYLATFLSLPLEQAYTEKIRHLDSESLRQRFFLAVRSWIEENSRREPIVVAISDMQWIDDSSLDLLRYCLPVCDSEALIWMLSFRPEREAPVWKFHHYLEAQYPHRLTSIELLPFTQAQSSELIDHLAGPGTLPAETRELITRNAGGNPFYILELIRVLIDQGILARESGDSPWRLTRPVTTLDMPGSLQRLLLARIDRLSAKQRMILQIASVIGPVFWLSILEALLEGPQNLRADLAALQRSQLIQESGRVPELGMQYFFKSPLIRETAYDSLLSPQRITYHLKAAQFLETAISPDTLSNYDGMLAYHYREAGIVKKELFYTFLAAEQERKMYASAEALQDYTRAMDLLDRLEADATSPGQIRSILAQRFEVLNGRRHVYFQLGQIQPGRADTEALLPLARQMSDDPVWLVDALTAQADIRGRSRHELIPGLQMAEEALALAQQLDDQQRVMRSLTRIANIRFNLNDPSWQELAERALGLARQLGDLKTEVNLLLAIGGKYGMDDLPRGREYLQEALSRSEKLNDKATRLSLLNAVGQQLERDGNYYRQLTEYEQERLRLSREIGHRIAEGSALMSCGQIQGLYLGDYEAGLELELQTLSFWENMNDRLFPLLRIAQIQTALGRHAEALATLEMARPLEEQVVMDIGRVGLGLVTAILYNAMGEPERLQSALEFTSQIQRMAADNLVSRQYHMAAACEGSAAHLKLGQSLSGSGERNAERQAHLAQALELSQSALESYQQFGFVQVVECVSEEILYRHSLALAANQRSAEAMEFLAQAHAEMMRKYDLIPPDSPFRKTFLENIELHREIQLAFAAQHPRPGLPVSPSSSNQERAR